MGGICLTEVKSSKHRSRSVWKLEKLEDVGNAVANLQFPYLSKDHLEAIEVTLQSTNGFISHQTESSENHRRGG